MRAPFRSTVSRAALVPLLLLIAASAPLAAEDARELFFERIAGLCGSVYEGFSSFPTDPGDAFAGKLLVATVSSCTEEEIRIPFAVGEDRSRTWILTRSGEGLLLQHDHRLDDGSPDEVTMYGGWAVDGGSATSQSFAADDHTKALIPEAATNVWTLALSEDGEQLTYSLERHAQPRFRATLARRVVEAEESPARVDGGNK
jgi:hypothetical protein